LFGFWYWLVFFTAAPFLYSALKISAHLALMRRERADTDTDRVG
jgi:hypothetical protein